MSNAYPKAVKNRLATEERAFWGGPGRSGAFELGTYAGGGTYSGFTGGDEGAPY